MAWVETFLPYTSAVHSRYTPDDGRTAAQLARGPSASYDALQRLPLCVLAPGPSIDRQ